MVETNRKPNKGQPTDIRDDKEELSKTMENAARE